MALNQNSKILVKKKYKLYKVGNSYKITLPPDFIMAFNFTEGDELTVASDINQQRFIVSKEE